MLQLTLDSYSTNQHGIGEKPLENASITAKLIFYENLSYEDMITELRNMNVLPEEETRKQIDISSICFLFCANMFTSGRRHS